MKRKVVAILIVVLIILFAFCLRQCCFKSAEESGETDNGNSKQIKVHFIDVGQGDSCFIELPNGKVMLIDSGDSKHAETVTNYIASLGYNTIDFVVATHADADHIGAMADVFEDFEIKNCYTSSVKSNTRTYKNFVKAVNDEGIKLKYPHSNDYIVNEKNLDVEVMGPLANKTYSNTNDSSVVLQVSYYKTDYLFTGDSEYNTLLEYNLEPIEVLKVSHHGSKTGTNKKLLNILMPKYAIISAAQRNRYNHPHIQVMNLLENAGVKIYKTSESGTITALSDATHLEFVTEK